MDWLTLFSIVALPILAMGWYPGACCDCLCSTIDAGCAAAGWCVARCAAHTYTIVISDLHPDADGTYIVETNGTSCIADWSWQNPADAGNCEVQRIELGLQGPSLVNERVYVQVYDGNITQGVVVFVREYDAPMPCCLWDELALEFDDVNTSTCWTGATPSVTVTSNRD